MNALSLLNRKPSLSSRAMDFWSDPYVSAHVLNAHLDDEHDMGSRRRERVRAEAAWIVSVLGMTETDGNEPAGAAGAGTATGVKSAAGIGTYVGADAGSGSVAGAKSSARRKESRRLVLDLGCGPGLYAAEFVRAGYDVYGIDISPASIKHACAQEEKRTRSARTKFGSASGRADFVLGDFSRHRFPRGAYGAVMIYGIFGNLTPRERDRTLEALADSLVPGARFVFDVFTEEFARAEALSERWYYAAKDGFWRPEPHLVLERSWVYEAQRTVLNAYYLIGEDAKVETRLVRHRWYDHGEVAEVLDRFGFDVVLCAGDLTGAEASGGRWFAVVAQHR